jgi:hypothetical protein
MIHGTIIKNGVLRLVLTGTDSIDEETLKQLNGAKVSFVSDNLRLFDKSLSGALILEQDDHKTIAKELPRTDPAGERTAE